MRETQPDDHFELHRIPTPTADGRVKMRDIVVPDEEARRWHASMLRNFYLEDFNDTRYLPKSAWVDGAMPGTQLLDGVVPHRNNWTFYKLDIKNAFPNVHIPTLLDRMDARGKEIGMRHDERDNLMFFMDRYATTRHVPGLPLGAPCSPYLFNFYLNEMDHELAALSEDMGYTYTRFLDDITISSPKKERTMGKDTRGFIRDIIEDTPGMRINHAKSRLHTRTKGPVIVTGVAIYPDGRIQPKAELLDKVHKTLDAIEAEVVLGHPMTPTHVGTVDGYHSVLKSMAVEPYNATMRESFDRYHTVARLVRAAIESDDYALPGRPPIDPAVIQGVEDFLVDAVYSSKDNRNEIAKKNPRLWKALLRVGLFDLPVPEPEKTAPAEPETEFDGSEGEYGTYLF